LKVLSGQRKIFRLKSWTGNEQGQEKRSNNNVQKSSTESPKKTSFVGQNQKSLSNASSFGSSNSSLLSFKKNSTNLTWARRKSPTNEVKMCLKELELFGTVKPTTDKTVLIETVKYLFGEIKKNGGEKNLESQNSKLRSIRDKPLKLPKLGRSI
jgi:hypothetical protein